MVETTFIQSYGPKIQKSDNVSGFNAMLVDAHDFISVEYPDDVTETYTYKSGGSGGTIVATITVVYTTSGKTRVASVTKLPKVN